MGRILFFSDFPFYIFRSFFGIGPSLPSFRSLHVESDLILHFARSISKNTPEELHLRPPSTIKTEDFSIFRGNVAQQHWCSDGYAEPGVLPLVRRSRLRTHFRTVDFVELLLEDGVLARLSQDVQSAHKSRHGKQTPGRQHHQYRDSAGDWQGHEGQNNWWIAVTKSRPNRHLALCQTTIDVPSGMKNPDESSSKSQ